MELVVYHNKMSLIRDLIALSGLVMVSVGTYQIGLTQFLIATGLMLVGVALLWSYVK